MAENPRGTGERPVSSKPPRKFTMRLVTDETEMKEMGVIPVMVTVRAWLAKNRKESALPSKADMSAT